MKIAFISDIHGNATALEAVLEDIQSKQVDKIVVLGDISYRGPEPKRALDLVRSLRTDVVKGNADEWIVRGVRQGEVPDAALEMMNVERDWTLKQLSEDDVNYLRELPTDVTISLSDELNIHAFHATPDSLFEVVKPDSDHDHIAEKMMNHPSAHIFLYAHIHLPYVRYINGKCIGNLGSVGLPFDGQPRSSYMIASGERDEYSLSIQRVKYDVEKVIQQLKDQDYPNVEFLSNVLRTGKL